MKRCKEPVTRGGVDGPCNFTYSCLKCHILVYHTPGFKWPPPHTIHIPDGPRASDRDDSAWAQPLPADKTD